MATLDDATGSGKQAKVGNENRLHTHSLSASINNVAAQDGEIFNVNTGSLTLTSANASALLYIENRENNDISVPVEFINQGNSTGGTGNATLGIVLNPTGGTLISDASAAQVLNRRVGDAKTVSLFAYKGAEGKTVTGGNEIVIPGVSSNLPSEYVIPKGASIAIKYTPPPGNTSQPVSIGALVIKNYVNYTVD